MMTTQLDRIEMLLFAQSAAAGLTQWITGWVAGENEGGMMVALYGKGGQFPACKVYSEKFYMLPDFVQQAIPETAAELPANRSGAERAGRLVECRPFQIARYRYGDDEKAKWRLAGVLRLGKEQEETAVAPPAQPAPPAKRQASGPPDSFFRQGDRVDVKGETGTRPGVVTGLGADGLIAVKVSGTIYRLSPERLIPVSLA